MIFIPNTKLLYNKFHFISITVLILLLFNLICFFKAYTASEYSFYLFNEIRTIDGNYYLLLKVLHIVSVIISYSFLSFIFYRKFFKNIHNFNFLENKITNNDALSLLLGVNLDTNEKVYIPEKGLYQNILVTGTIGTGKTSSAMYPFVKQLMSKNLGMLILDVKGNFHKKVIEFSKIYNRKVTVIELNGKETYNPLDKPNLKPSVLANRLRTILTLFSNQNTTDTYWLDKVESFLTEAIKLCRLYNDGYVTFVELHKIIYDKSYLTSKINIAREKFLANKFSNEQVYELSTCLDFFMTEYKNLDSKVLSIIQSEISRITQLFVNDLEVKRTFCQIIMFQKLFVPQKKK